MAGSERIHDKGENRRKHRGNCDAASVAREGALLVGKCPRGFSLEQAQALLDDAIPEYRERQPDRPYRLWSYHDGAVYLAFTSDGGTCWHGFPVPGDKIPRVIERQLEERAASTDELQALKRWLRQKF